MAIIEGVANAERQIELHLKLSRNKEYTINGTMKPIRRNVSNTPLSMKLLIKNKYVKVKKREPLLDTDQIRSITVRKELEHTRSSILRKDGTSMKSSLQRTYLRCTDYKKLDVPTAT